MSDNGMRRSVRLWLRLALAGGVVALAWLGMRPRPVEVDAATVTRGPFELTVEEDGETRIRDPYLISAPLSGRLERVELEPGDPISEGQVIASIDPGEPGLLDARTEAESEARVRVFEAAHRRTLTQVEKARAEETKAKRYYERDKVRQEKGEIALPMLEDAEHLLRVAQNDVSSAESAVDIAQFDVVKCSGVIFI
jgi:HlyD family secretion protein